MSRLRRSLFGRLGNAFLWVAGSVLVTSVLATSVTAEVRELKDLARQAKPSVVLLQIHDSFGTAIGTGSGFLVDANGWIVTNHHVIEDASQISVQLANLDVVPVRSLLAVDKANDLAILKVDGSGHQAMILARSSLDTEVGERVVVLGGPVGLASTLSEGIVSAVRLDGDPALARMSLKAALQITASISSGSSGSPVINPQGEVIGVVVSQVVDAQNLNFAVPIEALLDLLDRTDPTAPLENFREGLNPRRGFVRNLIVSVIFFALVGLGYRRLMR